MYFCVNEFEVGVNDSIFSGNERQKVYVQMRLITPGKILAFVLLERQG